MNAPTLSTATAAVSTIKPLSTPLSAGSQWSTSTSGAYDIAHGAAAVASARNLLGYGAHGEAEERLTVAFVADVAHDLATRLLGREADQCERALDSIHDFMAAAEAGVARLLVGGAPSP